MVTLDNLTEEQKEKRNRFYDFYFPEAVIMFSGLLNEEREKGKEQDFYQYYRNIIEKSARLLKEIGATDSLTASAAIQYLLWNGYFSKDKKLVYGQDRRVNNRCAFGADVVLGRSVCLNNADFETSVLKSLGKEAYIIGARVNTKEEANFEFKPNIERDIEECKNFWYNLFVKLVGMTPINRAGNHAVTLVKTEGQYIISDPTSLAYANITDFMKSTYVGSTFGIELKPWLMLVAEEMSIEKFKEIVESTLAYSDTEVLKTKLIKQVYNNGIYLCQRNNRLINDFHDDINSDIENVARTLVKIKK